MTDPLPGEPTQQDERPAVVGGRGSVDYAGAIYGSLLAASTVLGTAATSGTDVGSVELLAAVLVTALVFWTLHVYVRVVGRELALHTPLRAAMRAAAREESPILLAVLPPTIAIAAVALLVDDPGETVAWAALWAAVGGQVFWTWLAVRRVSTRWSIIWLSMTVSTVLGLCLIGFKFVAAH